MASDSVTPRSRSLLVFLLDEQRFGLPISSVDRVLRAVEIVKVPSAPPIILGVVNFHGDIIPILDLRGRLGLPARSLRSSDHLIIARLRGRKAGVIVDAVLDVMPWDPSSKASASGVLRSAPYVEDAVKLAGDIVFIHDLETFLSEHENDALDDSLRA